MEIDREAYTQRLRTCRLEALELAACSAELRVPKDELEYRFSTVVRPGSYTTDDPCRAVLEVKLALTAKARDSRRVGLKLAATWRLVIASDEELTEEFRQTYLDHNATFNLWPHFRAWVCDVTARMGLPPLVLPFRFG